MTSAELIQIRTQLGLKSIELARALKVRPETVWRWEHGTHISLKSATKILRLMGTEMCPTCGQPVGLGSRTREITTPTDTFAPYHLCPACRATLSQLFADNPWLTPADLSIPDIGGCDQGCPLVCLDSAQLEQLQTSVPVYSQTTPWGQTMHWVQRA